MSVIALDRRSIMSRALVLIVAMTLAMALVPMRPAPVRAEPDPAAAASGFATFKFPQPNPVCTGLGLNVSNAPYFDALDCGFVSFLVTGAAAAANVVVDFIGPDGATFETQQAVFDEVNGDWQFSITPEEGWPAGHATARVTVDGEVAGSTSFGFQVLGATLEVDPSGAPYAPGDALPVSGNVAQLDSATNLGPVVRTGVPASFTLTVVAPNGDAQAVPGGPITAGANGDFAAVVPGSLTEGLSPVGDDVELTIGVAATDASYDDPDSGSWASAEAGRTAVNLLASPTRLGLRARYVSSTGSYQNTR